MAGSSAKCTVPGNDQNDWFPYIAACTNIFEIKLFKKVFISMGNCRAFQSGVLSSFFCKLATEPCTPIDIFVEVFRYIYVSLVTGID